MKWGVQSASYPALHLQFALDLIPLTLNSCRARPQPECPPFSRTVTDSMATTALPSAIRTSTGQSTRLMRMLSVLVRTRSPRFTVAVVRGHATIAALSLAQRGARFTALDNGIWRLDAPGDLVFAVDGRALASDLHLISRLFGASEYDFLDFAGSVVMDIGANIGDSAIYFARRGARHVHALSRLRQHAGARRKTFS
jgi:hypothetical protein